MKTWSWLLEFDPFWSSVINTHALTAHVIQLDLHLINLFKFLNHFRWRRRAGRYALTFRWLRTCVLRLQSHDWIVSVAVRWTKRQDFSTCLGLAESGRVRGWWVGMQVTHWTGVLAMPTLPLHELRCAGENATSRKKKLRAFRPWIALRRVRNLEKVNEVLTAWSLSLFVWEK